MKMEYFHQAHKFSFLTIVAYLNGCRPFQNHEQTTNIVTIYTICINY